MVQSETMPFIQIKKAQALRQTARNRAVFKEKPDTGETRRPFY
ncbi:hypothetical protein ELI_0826 [Eubacterium callanderi]|uniref:Uncharacterized protein n=1 Tax=Eubacterium callanderi TaxID=53442 RepID=E3GJK5_9FIRM|nr:hypothetical protein ELI_0826 [Eubacterium callanderi]